MNPLEINKDETLNQNIGEIILYQPDDSIRIEVKVEDETVWLTQAQMTELFQTTVPNVNIHIKNIFDEGELEENTVIKKSLITAADGKKYRTKHYNLDVIISVGYRVKSKRGTQFRIWATRVLKEFLLRGYAINQRLKRIEQQIDFLVKTTFTMGGKLKNEVHQLKQYIEAIIADYNDINEDTRVQLELINTILAELQFKNKLIDKPRNPIGFITPKNDCKIP
jgi:hypothetical protein